MARLAIICAILICTTSIFAQRKTTEHKIKEISGSAVGGGSQSPEQVKQKAINAAKVEALKEAGVAENINSYTDYFRSETEDKMEELFTSDILSNINGTVKDVVVLESKPSFTPEGQIKCDVKISCTVVKYKTTKDMSFTAEIDGIKSVYKVGDGVSFKIKPHKNCYVRAFWFTTESFVLLPNEYETSALLSAQTNYRFPDENLIDAYEVTIDNEKLDRETNRLVILLLKEDLYYTGKIAYKPITDWIMSIPPDERLIESFAFEVFRE